MQESHMQTPLKSSAAFGRDVNFYSHAQKLAKKASKKITEDPMLSPNRQMHTTIFAVIFFLIVGVIFYFIYRRMAGNDVTKEINHNDKAPSLRDIKRAITLKSQQQEAIKPKIAKKGKWNELTANDMQMMVIEADEAYEQELIALANASVEEIIEKGKEEEEAETQQSQITRRKHFIHPENKLSSKQQGTIETAVDKKPTIICWKRELPIYNSDYEGKKNMDVRRAYHVRNTNYFLFVNQHLGDYLASNNPIALRTLIHLCENGAVGSKKKSGIVIKEAVTENANDKPVKKDGAKAKSGSKNAKPANQMVFAKLRDCSEKFRLFGQSICSRDNNVLIEVNGFNANHKENKKGNKGKKEKRQIMCFESEMNTSRLTS